MPGRLIPLSKPPENRPMVEPRPCPVCGTSVDPLRAGAVLLFEYGFRYLCSADCRKRYLEGERLEKSEEKPKLHRPKPKAKERIPSTAVSPALESSQRLSPQKNLIRGIWFGMGAVLCSIVMGFFSETHLFSVLSALLSTLAAVVALWASWRTVIDIGWLAWALGPIGAIGAAISAAHATVNGVGGTWLSLEGAALAAFAMLLRAWFDAEARIPVNGAIRALQQNMPDRVQVPVKDSTDPLEIAVQEVPTQKVRTGEDVFANEGEIVAVDGVVQAGDAMAYLYPGARTPMRRLPGDPLLAGAKIVKGTVRILAARVGANRALVRLERFGSGAGRSAAPIAKMANLVTQWGGLATIALASVVFVLADNGAVAAPLSAASAVLLAAPLLAIRRAAESPLLAAAANAGARGIVFQSAQSLDRAGRIATVALSPHGILTEGKPVVLEVLPITGRSVESLVALCVSAEEAAATHPIAIAIRNFALANRIAPRNVRRASYFPGRGVTALAPGGEELVIGNRKLLLDHGISVAAADTKASTVESNGRTAVFVALGGRVRCVISLQDILRPGARAATQRMLDLNLEVVLLTGDQRATVEKLATGLDIVHIKSELSVEERGKEVKRLRDAGGLVAVIGYPSEDHDALSSADASIALESAGSTSSDQAVALVTRDVRDAAAALWIARAARESALGSTSFAAGAFAAIIAAAATGLIMPAIAALLAVAVDAYAVRAGSRLLRRIALRLPERN